ncbi:hypothetical protein [Bifidobacterium aerophilum]|uniref:Uncharacterized protein n=1 Tax=Bifidobacterium aerophilum TaxID=1798155 RepID=A0A6N9Z774_9BIFI|nr:hypothetical protein [Bifidobacterium aerophilum]NEG90492.1 hypothetical protein [Bifidobacterium aerophilum]
MFDIDSRGHPIEVIAWQDATSGNGDRSTRTCQAVVRIEGRFVYVCAYEVEGDDPVLELDRGIEITRETASDIAHDLVWGSMLPDDLDAPQEPEPALPAQ